MENVNDLTTLVYAGEHPTLGSLRCEVTPRGYGPTSVATYINGQLVGRSGFDNASLARQLKGLTLIERRAGGN